jgi:hypothetical protein
MLGESGGAKIANGQLSQLRRSGIFVDYMNPKDRSEPQRGDTYEVRGYSAPTELEPGTGPAGYYKDGTPTELAVGWCRRRCKRVRRCGCELWVSSARSCRVARLLYSAPFLMRAPLTEPQSGLSNSLCFKGFEMEPTVRIGWPKSDFSPTSYADAETNSTNSVLPAQINC